VPVFFSQLEDKMQDVHLKNVDTEDQLHLRKLQTENLNLSLFELLNI
jgi:hypothetical protein